MKKTCELCGKKFSKSQQYSAHKRFQHPNWREDLNAVMKYRPELAAAANGPPIAETFACLSCKREFLTKQALAAHVRWCKEHGHDDQPPLDYQMSVYCPYCGKDLTELVASIPFSYCPHCGRDVEVILRMVTGASEE